ncbi:histidine phosphatase family protein [soil metagenome]
MLRLMLLRHAKSSWTDPASDDRDRPLSGRGHKAAAVMGAFMRREKLIPELVLCSPARRARDTWKLASGELRAAPRTIVEDGLYDFGNGGRVLDAIRDKAEGAKSLLIVGHNPSIERLALRLVGKGTATLKDQLERKYPTGALSVIDFKTDAWKEIGDGAGRLVSFTRPRDLVRED